MRVLVSVIGGALLVLQSTQSMAWYTPWSQGGFGGFNRASSWSMPYYNMLSPWGSDFTSRGFNAWPNSSRFNAWSGFQPWGGFNTFQPWSSGWGGGNPWGAWQGNYGGNPYNYPHWQAFSHPASYQQGYQPSTSGYNPWVNNLAQPSSAYAVAAAITASPLAPLYNSNIAKVVQEHNVVGKSESGLIYPDDLGEGSAQPAVWNAPQPPVPPIEPSYQLPAPPLAPLPPMAPKRPRFHAMPSSEPVLPESSIAAGKVFAPF
ncbi:hypothetical protein [Thiofilum flexile]|uniref:hypothetical protein n=1 Tax=Thiofilum flexile TaxID=125627 RepID=UPI00036DCD66|nr:hypothetical protein [Thiofilum flexile]